MMEGYNGQNCKTDQSGTGLPTDRKSYWRENNAETQDDDNPPESPAQPIQLNDAAASQTQRYG